MRASSLPQRKKKRSPPRESALDPSTSLIPPLPEEPPSVVFGVLLAVLTALFLCGIFSPEAADTDFWWHL